MSRIRWTVVVWSVHASEPMEIQSFGVYTELARAQAVVNLFKNTRPEGIALAAVMPIYPERTRKTIIERLRHIGFKLIGIN